MRSGWDDKVARLLHLMDTAPQDDTARKLVLSAVDVIVAEVLAGSAALHELMGKSDNLAGALRQAGGAVPGQGARRRRAAAWRR